MCSVPTAGSLELLGGNTQGTTLKQWDGGKSWYRRTAASWPLCGGQPGACSSQFSKRCPATRSLSPTHPSVCTSLAFLPSLAHFHTPSLCTLGSLPQQRTCTHISVMSCATHTVLGARDSEQSKPWRGAQSHRITVPTVEESGKLAPSETWHSLWQWVSAL